MFGVIKKLWSKQMIDTKRLTLRPASDREMTDMITKESNEILRQAYTEMLSGCQKHPEQRIWYAIWLVALADGTLVGTMCFKGLNQDGIAEAGYGVEAAYEGNGYATEAVSAIAQWALEQKGVKQIEAETDPENIASQRVLTKAGFVKNGVIGEEGPRYVWMNKN